MIRLIKKLCPPALLAEYDYRVLPPVSGESAALNGQRERQRMFGDFFVKGRFVAIVETGTFRGATSEYFARKSGLPVHTVECSLRHYYYSKKRFRRVPEVRLYHGDSRSFLGRLMQDPAFPKQRVLFYLDAHWNEDLPLYEELKIIFSGWTESVIVIDDFRVPGEPYGYDSYGEGKILSIEYLRHLDFSKHTVFWPAAPASKETGLKRGSVILVTKDAMLDDFKGIESVRKDVS